jgi:FkbM family methyltransferase
MPPFNGYSYQGQDALVLELLGARRGGYFIDSGASSGLKGSNTKLLESAFAWDGICIEPNDSLFAQLVQNRDCVCLNCCLYDREGIVDFFESAGVYGGILSEYEPSLLSHARRAVNAEADQTTFPETVLKPARTIGEVLRSCGAPRVIDYWSLDTEGSELAILKSFPYDEYRFTVLTIEHNHGSARASIHSFLATLGYRRVASLGIDDCYMWAGGGGVQPWRSRAWARGRRASSAIT